MKKIIKNGKLVTPDGVIVGSIVIDARGKIEKIIQSVPNEFKGEIYDAKGHYILPGLTEVHGHLREPGLDTKEDIPHGTRAALAGGFTTVIDMPNTKPPTVTVALLQEKIKKIYPARSYIDYAFFLGVAADKIDELEKVDPKDIVGVKVFMAGHETTPTTIPDDVTLAKIIDILAKRNILLAVHAEDQWLINYYNDQYKKTGRTDAALWSEIRPTSVVVTAAARAIALASSHKKFRLYLLHLSTPEEFALVEAAKKRGQIVYGELVGYQLAFNESDYKKYGNKIKVAPALRTVSDQDKNWELFKGGRIDVVCSEHTPHEWETKNQPNMWKAQAGTPGIQETLPVLVTGWVKRYGKHTLDEGLSLLVKYTCENPSKIFNLVGKDGIKIGNDADLVIIDTDNVWKVKKTDLFSKCGWSAYEGKSLIGKPIATYLRGARVYENGKIIGNPQGKQIKNI